MNELRERLRAATKHKPMAHIAHATRISTAVLYRFRLGGGLSGTHAVTLMKHLNVTVKEAYENN